MSQQTSIEQIKEALQEVSDTMDRKGGVAPIIRTETLNKVNAALALLKTMEEADLDKLSKEVDEIFKEIPTRTMEGEPVAWMHIERLGVKEFVSNELRKEQPSYAHLFTVPLYRHPSPQSDAYTEGDVYKAIDRLGIGGSDIARDLMYNLRNPKS